MINWFVFNKANYLYKGNKTITIIFLNNEQEIVVKMDPNSKTFKGKILKIYFCKNE
jgi:hypothetical protein